MPLKKIAVAEDIATQIVILSSAKASGHVSGQVITIAGGMEGELLVPYLSFNDSPVRRNRLRCAISLFSFPLHRGVPRFLLFSGRRRLPFANEMDADFPHTRPAP